MKKLFPFLLAALCLGSFCSCGTNITYKNAEKYSVGGSTVTGVARLEIGWLDGSVAIGTHDGEGVIFSETASRELGDADKLRYWLNGDKLYLQYARAGRVNLKNLNKELTVLLPAGTGEGAEISPAVRRRSLPFPEICLSVCFLPEEHWSWNRFPDG